MTEAAGARRIGIFGGAFNPPHHGHLICAQEARIQLDLDEVRIVPFGDPPHRRLSEEPGRRGEHRLAMTRLALKHQPGLEASTIEIDREGPSYTVDTLTALTDQEPGARLTLIIGSDAAAALGTWRDPEQIGRLAQIAVATRAGHDWSEVTAEVERATGAPALGFTMPRVDISSTQIRAHVRAGQSVAHFVPADVAGYIEQEGLYR